MDLFRIRRKIQENMTLSGQHDSVVWKFVQPALSEGKGITKNAAYYFFMRCEEHKEVDASFCPLHVDCFRRQDESTIDWRRSHNLPTYKILCINCTNIVDLLGLDA